ncbi:tripartite motif containing 13 [Parelaphostrongylus tenuis]|uniref:Tripartite motif containing 13 n=1 Tax=Parelaphostrongylus tenuis TaxID=148309 RepID=A0AAD5QM78_PARTN|nr:tripartite motif containing 13 [Parelaphostrongylus tenuis]
MDDSEERNAYEERDDIQEDNFPEERNAYEELEAPEDDVAPEEHNANEERDASNGDDSPEERDIPVKYEEIQDLLECVICTFRMARPTQLSCGHTFCIDCIGQMVNEGLVVCPQCRQPTRVPQSGLPLNFYALNVISALEEISQSRKKAFCCHQCFKRIESTTHYLCKSCKKERCTA